MFDYIYFIECHNECIDACLVKAVILSEIYKCLVFVNKSLSFCHYFS
jgi:hypothetical protein